MANENLGHLKIYVYYEESEFFWRIYYWKIFIFNIYLYFMYKRYTSFISIFTSDITLQKLYRIIQVHCIFFRMHLNIYLILTKTS